MADTNTQTTKISLTKTEFLCDYRGTFGSFSAGKTYEIKTEVYKLLQKSGICKTSASAGSAT